MADPVGRRKFALFSTSTFPLLVLLNHNSHTPSPRYFLLQSWRYLHIPSLILDPNSPSPFLMLQQDCRGCLFLCAPRKQASARVIEFTCLLASCIPFHCAIVICLKRCCISMTIIILIALWSNCTTHVSMIRTPTSQWKNAPRQCLYLPRTVVDYRPIFLTSLSRRKS